MAEQVIGALVVLGATGDLTGRYLLPAIAELEAAGRLPDGFGVIGVARDDWDDAGFRRYAADSLAGHAPDIADQACQALCDRLEYHHGDVTDPEVLRRAVHAAEGPVAVHLALPHTIFADTLRALAAADLPAGSRLVVEKPFGAGLADARQLNQLIREAFAEDDVFRVDHFLGFQTVRNLLGLRFANRMFEPVWNAVQVQQVDIVWDETLALEGRAGYYDTAGALRDMLQNHLLQLLALVAMEPPTALDQRALRDRKLDVFRAVRSPSQAEIIEGSRRARYSSGTIGDRTLPAYRDEPGVDASRGTETFAELTLFIDNWRWAGVPFRLRSGKALARDRREIVVRFRPVPHLLFDGTIEPDVLRLSIDPASIVLEINLNGAAEPFELARDKLTVEMADQELPPYSMVLLGVLRGDPTLSIRADEAEECWRIVEPVLGAWRDDLVPLEEYPAGSSGPS